MNYKVSSPVEYQDKNGDNKVFWQQLGRAFTNAKGGIVVKLNALPIGNTLFLLEDDGRGSNRRGGRGGNNYNGGSRRQGNDSRGGGYPEDEVPF